MELPIDSLVGEMSGTAENRAIWSCLGLEETFIEKIVAFLRRSLRGTRGRIEERSFDLVRHLYDVVMIQRHHNIGQNRNLTILFREVVQADAREFANQDAEFARDPMKAFGGGSRKSSRGRLPAVCPGYGVWGSPSVCRGPWDFRCGGKTAFGFCAS